ncbi:MAG: type I restriction endonuclease subunit R [Bacteroidales bacterium]|nr:type I restriction endonuclease subunit R [Bacteroidales bacterium]
MANYITEDDIEQSLLEILEGGKLKYNNIIRCDANPLKRENLDDGTSRTSKKQCVLPQDLKTALYKHNPDIPKENIDGVISDLCRDFSGTDMSKTNYDNYKKIRDGIKVEFKTNGKKDFKFLKLIDFENPEDNIFTAVSQMWIQGQYSWRRPDVIIFVNGLPVVFVELKNAIVKIEEAYNKNLTDYKKDIPNLFAFNQICVLSNGLETRLGAWNAGYEFFFEWLKTDSEKENPDRKAIHQNGTSIEFFAHGLCNKNHLIDYIENFVIFQNQNTKIIAKNHQFLGVNNLMNNVNNREELGGKLGVFWHTQGSGKSYSMVFFTRKCLRKLQGNFTFFIVTDRTDLDTQIYKNFVRTEVIGPKEDVQPKNSEQLREYLKSNKRFIFSMIHKFRYDKGKKYPVLSTRNDIFVLIDEAHRTQYKDLAENMHTALPNANFIAFTGTPLLGTKRLTNQWFGDYVSEYNFAQSVEDGSTVPLFYSRRVPEVGLTNNFLDDDLLDIIEDENLNEAETKRLEDSGSKIIEVLKRDDRLEKIAKDIAHHFPRRGFLGKGMVVSVDKFTAVRMYNKVQHYWNLEKKQLIEQRNTAATKEERDQIKNIIKYMDSVEMAVIVSEEADEDKKFAAEGLNIKPHRDKMNEIVNGIDIEDRFKDPHDRLQLVFVCAMWLTGFDVPSLSTLYLDKPMKGHTLMQAIARANRVFPGKQSGIIIDYVNVFKYMQQALSDYATGSDGKEFPAKDIDKLLDLIDQTISEADSFLKDLGISLDDINTLDTNAKLDALKTALDLIYQNDGQKERFKVITNTMLNLYEASKPEVFELGWQNPKFSPLKYMNDLMNNNIDDEKLSRAKNRLNALLDNSVSSQNPESQTDVAVVSEPVIHEFKIIDLSKVDVEALRREIRQAEYKAIEISDLREHIEKMLHKLINRNTTRIKFSERYRDIIDRYNAGGSENEDYYEQLLQLIQDLKTENSRAAAEGLSEAELEMYDLLSKGRHLTKNDEQKVKLAAKNLFQKLSANKKDLFIVDWYKDAQAMENVKSAVISSLNTDLPDSFDKEAFDSKINLLFNHFIDMTVQHYGWLGFAA